MKLTVLTYNTLFAGYDDKDDRRARAQIGLVNELRPDVFFMQEAKGLDADGHKRLFALEKEIDMRGFLAIAPHTGQNVAIFIRVPLTPISFEADGTHFHHALATLEVGLPDQRPPLTLICAHLCPYGPNVRRREAAYLAPQASPDDYALLAGDFNSSSPHDPEPKGFSELSMRHRSRYVGDDLKTVDRSVLARLEASGWIDVGHTLGTDVPTVPTAGFPNTEFAVMRCDYIMASASLAKHAFSYQVIRTPVTDMASDHYPVLVRFEV